MAGKPRNRLELRRQHEAAEPLDPMEDEPDDLADDNDDADEGERKPKRKPKAAAKSKAKTVKVPKPAARVRIVWTVVNDAFKPVGTFEYSQKEAAYARAAELTAKGKGTHFVQKVKEPMPDDAPGLGAAIPRPVPAPVPVAAVIAPTATSNEDDEDNDNDNDDDADDDTELDDDDETDDE
ncbi:MAG: hypothetical protein ABI353_10285 [Isosphaeraceae bacterium]